mgnify:FL=1
MGLSTTITSLVLIFSLTLASAKPASREQKKKNVAFKLALKEYEKRKYKTSLKILNKYFHYSEIKTSAPSKVFLLAAKSYERLGDLRNALKYYERIIIKDHSKLNDKIMRMMANDQAESLPEMPENLQFLYYKKSVLYSKIFQKELYKKRAASVTVMNQYYANVQKYKKICDSLDEYECKQTERIIRIVTSRLDAKKQRTYGSRYFGSLGYITWQEELQLTNITAGTNFSLLSTTQGWCAGGGYVYENEFSEFNLSACLAFARATVSENNLNNSGINGVGYKQSSVPVLGLFFGPAYYWRIQAREVSFGVSVKGNFREGDYSDATAGGNLYRVQGKSTFDYGSFLEGKYELPKWDLVMKYGFFSKMKSSIWSLQANYKF